MDWQVGRGYLSYGISRTKATGWDFKSSVHDDIYATPKILVIHDAGKEAIGNCFLGKEFRSVSDSDNHSSGGWTLVFQYPLALD